MNMLGNNYSWCKNIRFLFLVFYSLVFMFCKLLFHLTLWSGLLCACNILILSATSDLKAVRLGTYRWLDQIQVARITRRRASTVCVSGFGASWARERIELSASFLHVECHVILLLKASELNHNNRVQNQKWWVDLMRVVLQLCFPSRPIEKHGWNSKDTVLVKKCTRSFPTFFQMMHFKGIIFWPQVKHGGVLKWLFTI